MWYVFIWLHIYVGVCLRSVCTSGPLLTCLFIKCPLLQISGVQNAAECVNDKMIYRNIPKIKSYAPGGGQDNTPPSMGTLNKYMYTQTECTS